jgi:phosphate transport system permease protein
MNSSLYFRRRVINGFNLTMATLTMAFALFWLGWILYTLLHNGFSALSVAVFTQNTPAPGSAGGLANAIVGSLLMNVTGTLIGTPIGVLAGIYLAEYGERGWIAPTVRFINDILLSAPSIVIGVFVWVVVVNQMKGFSGFAGAIALAIIVIPVVLRTTENMLKLVPHQMREAAYALGAPKYHVIASVTLRASRAGVLTGILLAVSRIAGETAPLLFTALGNPFMSFDMTKPMGSLPQVIFQFAMSPFEDWKQLAWAGALIITIAVLALNVIARTVLKKEHQH